MKKKGFYSLLLCMSLSILLLMMMPCSASAVSPQVFLAPQSGTIDEGEYRELDFYVPTSYILTIQFIGYEDGLGTYGDYFAWLKDSNGDIFWNDYDYTGYDDRTFTIDVEAGNYKLGLRCEDWKFDYYLTVTGIPQQETPVTSLKLNAGKAKMEVGKTKQLKASYAPYYTTDELTWSSSNKKVATVDSNGKVKAKSLGTATITAKMGNLTAKCKITVNSTDLVVARKFTQSLNSLTKNISGLKKSTYKSSRASVAAVSKAGKVTAKKNGTAKITVQDKKKNKYTITVKVKNPVTATVSYIDDTSIYNEVGLKFKNNSGKKITYIRLNIAQYDNRGIRLESPYDYFYCNNTIRANDSLLWEYWVNDDTKRVKVSITEVWFSNGSIWRP